MYSAFLSNAKTGKLRNSYERFTALSFQCALLSFGLLTLAGAGCNNDDATVDNISADETANGPNASNKDNFRKLHRQNPGIHNQWWQKDDKTLLTFCLSVPAGLDPEDKVPLVLFLHQGAKTYTRFFANDMLGLLVLPILGDTRAIVVAPDILDNSWTSERNNEQIMALLEEVCKTYTVDRDRILVMGYSMGASGVWQFVSRYPDFFTAGLPVAGGPISNFADIKWTVPMLCVQSTNDEVFPAIALRRAVEQLQKIDMTVQLHEVNGISHYSAASYIEPCKYAINWIKQGWDRKTAGEVSN